MSDNKTQTMKAVGFTDTGAAAEVFKAANLPVPTPGARDILVRVLSIALNPVDTKVRKGAKKDGASDAKEKPVRVVGWDCLGVVTATGADAKSFAVGDRVYFAGDITRAGCNAEFVAVDERLAAKAPTKLSNDEAATVPLVALTAWEAFSEAGHLKVPTSDAEKKSLYGSKSMLIIAGAGGVGSIAIQLAKRVWGFGVVVASTSRPETEAWCKAMGADATINHKKPMAAQLAALGLKDAKTGAGGVDVVFNCAETRDNLTQSVEVVANFGQLLCITHPGPAPQQDFSALFNKRASLAFEFMFAKSMHAQHQETQGAILATVAGLLDSGVLKHTMQKRYDGLTVDNLVAAHVLQESGTSIGKIAITVAAK